jgi:hypothetical protein
MGSTQQSRRTMLPAMGHRPGLIRRNRAASKRTFPAGGLFGALLLIAGSCVAAEPAGRIEKSGEWDRIQNGEYLIENNTWNIHAGRSNWQQTIFFEPATGHCGWKWDFSGEKDSNPKTYPEIIWGKKPFDNYKSTTPRLPVALTNAQFRLDYDYVSRTTGSFNTSTDISFTDSTNPGPANIRAKLMIWLDRRNMPFFEAKTKKRAVIGGRQHEVFIDSNHDGSDGKWVFVALLAVELPTRGELNLREYFDYCLSEGVLKPEWFLSSIEVGSELASGKGEIVFRRFAVH